MNVCIGSVVELPCPDGAIGLGFAEAFGQTSGSVNVVVRITVAGSVHQAQVCTVKIEKFDFFPTLTVRHDHYAFVAQRVGDQCQADSRITGGAFHDRASGPQAAVALCRSDDAQGSAVFD